MATLLYIGHLSTGDYKCSNRLESTDGLKSGTVQVCPDSSENYSSEPISLRPI